MKEDPKKPKATPAKKKSSTTNAENSVKNTAKASKLLQDTTPLMSADASFKHTVTASSRRNKSTVINRTDRYKNIEDRLDSGSKRFVRLESMIWGLYVLIIGSQVIGALI